MKNGTVTKRMFLLSAAILLLLLCAGTASAYSFTFVTPDEQTATLKQGVGSPIVVECTTDIPPGATINIVLAKSGGNAVKTESVIIQSDKHFGATFDTSGLAGGMYTVTVTTQNSKDYPLGSKRNWFTVELVDRTSELTNLAARVQSSSDTVDVTGRASVTGSRGVELTMYAGSVVDGTIVYGPNWVGTDATGKFSVDISTEGHGYGMYQVVVKDKDGYIGVLTYTLMTSSTTTSPATPTATSLPTKSASAIASKESPAYFSVKTGTGTTEIKVIRGVDWIVDYSLSGATAVRVNNADNTGDEKFTVEGNGAVLNLMIYPADDSQAKVYVYCENAVSITEDPALADVFGKPGVDPNATSTPVPVLLPFAGVIGAAVLLRRR